MRKVLFRQLQNIELQDEGKLSAAVVFILLTYPTRNQIPYPEAWVPWFITVVPRAHLLRWLDQQDLPNTFSFMTPSGHPGWV